MLHGAHLIGNVTYYFNPQTGAQVTGVVYNSATNKLQYYGATNGSLSKNAEFTIAKKVVKSDADGNIILNDGENEINNQWYYYDAHKKKLIALGTILIDKLGMKLFHHLLN